MKDKKIVLLIDAENTSAKYADCIISYLEKQGVIISKRVYGDFVNNNCVKAWDEKAIKYEMQQEQVITTNAGKNASDIALVIDAIKFLYEKKDKIDAFCIVTSDGDFTRLIKEIREHGIEVIGIGKADASKRLEKVCDAYMEFDDLLSNKKNIKNNKQKQEEIKKPIKSALKTNKKIVSLDKVEKTLSEFVQQDEKAGKYADLGGIKSRLQKAYPGFDEKNYGYQSIRQLIDKETKFSVCQNEKHTYLLLNKKKTEIDQVMNYILLSYPKMVIGLHEISELGRKLHSEFPEFSYKEYGYKKLSSLLEKIGFEVY